MALRDQSLDIFRGLSIAFMVLVNTPGSWNYIYWPLSHAQWHGLTPTDLVFPFFLFAVGSSLFFALHKHQERKAIIIKAMRRSLVLFTIGILLNAYPFWEPFHDLRIMGVLQRIAICYFFALLIILYSTPRILSLLCIVILLCYWAFMGLDPYLWSLENNKVLMLDLQLLGANHMYQGYGIPFEPEGILSTIPATVSVIAGYLTTLYLFKQTTHQGKIRFLLGSGVTCTALGLLWSIMLPINKPLWSSSYVMLHIGLAQIMLCIIHLISHLSFIDKILKPIEIMGTNPLLIYVLSWLFAATLALPMAFPFTEHTVTISGVFHNLVSFVVGNYFASFLHAIITLLIFYGVSLFLYNKKIFLKL